MKPKSIIPVLFIFSTILLTLYSCSKNGKDNPGPDQTETGVRKKMSTVITVTGINEKQSFTVAILNLIEINGNSGHASPVIDDRDGNIYSEIVYHGTDFKDSKKLSSHSQKKVSATTITLLAPGVTDDITPKLSINIKIYAGNKLIDQRTYKDFNRLNKVYTIYVNGN